MIAQVPIFTRSTNKSGIQVRFAKFVVIRGEKHLVRIELWLRKYSRSVDSAIPSPLQPLRWLEAFDNSIYRILHYLHPYLLPCSLRGLPGVELEFFSVENSRSPFRIVMAGKVKEICSLPIFRALAKDPRSLIQRRHSLLKTGRGGCRVLSSQVGELGPSTSFR